MLQIQPSQEQHHWLEEAFYKKKKESIAVYTVTAGTVWTLMQHFRSMTDHFPMWAWKSIIQRSHTLQKSWRDFCFNGRFSHNLCWSFSVAGPRSMTYLQWLCGGRLETQPEIIILLSKLGWPDVPGFRGQSSDGGHCPQAKYTDTYSNWLCWTLM